MQIQPRRPPKFSVGRPNPSIVRMLETSEVIFAQLMGKLLQWPRGRRRLTFYSTCSCLTGYKRDAVPSHKPLRSTAGRPVRWTVSTLVIFEVVSALLTGKSVHVQEILAN
jgi:hypothetical protein